MATPSIRRIERLNYVIGGVMTVVAALTQPRAITLGFAVGAALTSVNFYALRRLVEKWTAQAAAGKPPQGQYLLLPKMMALLIAAGLAIVLLPIDPIAFVVGYSIFIVSIVVETTYAALRGEPAVAPDGDPQHDPNHQNRESDHG